MHARQLGGKLADPAAIQMYRQGKSVITIGFVSPLQKYAEYFQTSESRTMTKAERFLFAKLGFPNYPTEYFSVKWVGMLLVPTTETYRLSIEAQNTSMVELIVNGARKLVYNDYSG